MRIATAVFIGLSAGIAIGAGTAQRWGSDIWSAVGSMPQPTATIAAAVLGFGVIAWQARLGFGSLIRAQEHRAELEAKARLDQDRLHRGQVFDQKTRDRLEDILRILHEHAHWLDVERNRWAFGEQAPNLADPLPQGIALVAVYFPALKNDIDKLDAAARTLQQWMYAAGQRRLAKQIATINEGFDDAYRPYRIQYERTLASLEEFGRQLWARDAR